MRPHSRLLLSVLAAAALAGAPTAVAAQRGKEVRLVTAAYSRGFTSKEGSVKFHLRLNQDEKPGDRPVFLWPLSATNPTWVLVPEFSADLGRSDDVAPNNVVANLRFETARAEVARRATMFELGPQWNAARDFSTSLLLGGAGVTLDWVSATPADQGVAMLVELGLRGDLGPRLNEGSVPDRMTYRATASAGASFERSGSSVAAALTVSGKLFGFAHDSITPEPGSVYTNQVLAAGSVGLELRPQHPDLKDPSKRIKSPISVAIKYSRGHSAPLFKLQNSLDLGLRLYWAPAAP